MPKEFEIEIEKIVQEGYGLSRDKGKVVLTPFVLPGEKVKVFVEEEKKDLIFAYPIKIISKNENRVKPVCKYFGECGGCHFQMANYNFQLKLKEDIVKDAFHHIAKIKDLPLEPIVPSPEILYYRTRAHFPLKRVKGKVYAGFYKRESHYLISISDCPIQKKIIIDLMLKIKDIIQEERITIYDENEDFGRLRYLSIRTNKDEKENLITFVTKRRGFPKRIVNRVLELGNITGIVENINPTKGNIIFGEEERVLYGRDYIFEHVGDLTFRVSSRSFFQVNPSILPHLIDIMREEIKGYEVLIDLYGGVGLFGFSFSKFFKKVYIVEISESSCKDAIYNQRINDFFNVEIIKDDAANALNFLKGDIFIIDPPRKGVEKEVIEGIEKIKPHKILYLSCYPPTVARDTVNLISLGYDLKRLISLDFFPQTYHVETLAIFERKIY
ncbi:MAG: 23S rRNA (uracil(1939)-C(5))-methyltransferase RlmD [Candidatus Hydrothermales bacterium]